MFLNLQQGKEIKHLHELLLLRLFADRRNALLFYFAVVNVANSVAPSSYFGSCPCDAA